MPLLPEMQAFLDRLPPPSAAPATIQGQRRAIEQRSALVPRRRTDIAGTRDLTLPGPGSDLRARLYLPHGAAAHPVVVYFHGGGFAAYSIDTHDGLAREVCQGAGALVLSVDYRLAPETPFPGAVEDALTTVRWAHDAAATWQGDAGRLAVAGDSAGANLAIACTRAARTGDLPALRAALLLYPPTDLTRHETASSRANSRGYFLTVERMEQFNRWYLRSPDDATDPRASPLLADDLTALAPTFLATAEYDPLRDDGRAYAERLRRAGVEVEHRDGPGLLHGFANLVGLSPTAAGILDEALAWLRAHLA